jgi:hypothetical protein
MIAVLLSEVVARRGAAGRQRSGLAARPRARRRRRLYFGLWRYYRNTHQVAQLRARDAHPGAARSPATTARSNEIKGTKKTSIDGDNVDDHRQRVQRVQ